MSTLLIWEETKICFQLIPSTVVRSTVYASNERSGRHRRCLHARGSRFCVFDCDTDVRLAPIDPYFMTSARTAPAHSPYALGTAAACPR
jgi:hypothetical protein